MSKKQRERIKRQAALDQTRAWLAQRGDQGELEVAVSRQPTSIDRLLLWSGALGFDTRPELRPIAPGGLDVWHLDLGAYESASLELQSDWGRCYGKGRNCLTDGADGTTSIEVEVGRRLQAAGWRAGWWNNYADRQGLAKGGPTEWRDGELDKLEMRDLAAHQLPRLASLLRPGSGVADVIAVSGNDVVAAECKCVSRPKPDTFKKSQVGWATAFIRKFGVGSYAVIEWRRQ